MPMGLPPAASPYHHRDNPSVSYAFHVGYIGNSMEDSLVFKARVQELKDQKILTFTEEGPNVRTDEGECSHW